MMTTRRKSALPALMLAVPLLLCTLVGCSDSTTPTIGGSSSSFSEQSFKDYDLAFAACMREQGVGMPDPGGSDGSVLAAGNDPAFAAALAACAKKLGPAPGGAGSSGGDDRRDSDLVLAACLRKSGIDVPDPEAGQVLSLPMDADPDVVKKCTAQAGATSR